MEVAEEEAGPECQFLLLDEAGDPYWHICRHLAEAAAQRTSVVLAETSLPEAESFLGGLWRLLHRTFRIVVVPVGLAVHLVEMSSVRNRTETELLRLEEVAAAELSISDCRRHSPAGVEADAVMWFVSAGYVAPPVP